MPDWIIAVVKGIVRVYFRGVGLLTLWIVTIATVSVSLGILSLSVLPCEIKTAVAQWIVLMMKISLIYCMVFYWWTTDT